MQWASLQGGHTWHDQDQDDDGLLDADNEIDGPDMTEMGEVMGAISSNLAASVRKWCFANGKIPSDLIDRRPTTHSRDS